MREMASEFIAQSAEGIAECTERTICPVPSGIHMYPSVISSWTLEPTLRI